MHQAYIIAITHICTPEEIDMLHKQTMIEHDERPMDQTMEIVGSAEIILDLLHVKVFFAYPYGYTLPIVISFVL